MASPSNASNMLGGFSSDEDIEAMDFEELNGPSFTEDNSINILLIGETGVGKSTFINAFANYLRYDNLGDVEKNEPMVLIPCKFTVTDENYELREVKIGSSRNETDTLGQSSTQDPKEYQFPISNGEKWVRLIDTPGIGDTRGIDQDTLNCQKIIGYISRLKVIHGIMFLMKPNSSRITVLFEFCMKQILSRLEKSASNNLLFVFTNTRGTCYRPGETLPCLRAVLENISKKPPYVNIPLSKENIFCLDNEAFRYLAAIANRIKFTDKERQYFAESWDKSAEESWRMIFRITGDEENTPLQPHQVENTMCVNEAREIINQLKQPMADITQLIQDKLRALQNHTELLEMETLNIKDLRKNLFIPIVDIEVMELAQPVTVCTSSQCAEIYKVREVQKWHYVQRCHNPCYLQNVPREMIGAPELLQCWAMNGTKTCRECKCDYSTHMHIYYESKTVDKTIENDNVKKSITSKEELKKEKENIIQKMETMKDELEDEHKTIIRYIAKFANFLQNNAITPYNDAYRQYISYLIDQEKSLGEDADMEKIKYLFKCQKEYDEAKKLFDNAINMKNQDGESILTASAVKKSVDELFKLKHTGKKIKELYTSQQTARKYENFQNAPSAYAPRKKSNKSGGILNRYASKFKNYLGYVSDEDNESRGSSKNYYNNSNSRFGKKSNASDEDNESYKTSKTYYNPRSNKKSNNEKKKSQNKPDYEDQLKKMQEEASVALAALACDGK